MTGDLFMSNIDTLDERILSELQHNGRLTMKALAERVGLSSPAMIERVRRLEERGVLAGYRAIIDPAAIGRVLSALISADVDRRYHEAFLSRLRSEPAVEECYRTTGSASFLVKVHVASAEELELLIDELGDVGAKCESTLILSIPIQTAPIVPPEGSVNQRTRLTRRRRRTTSLRTEEPTTAPARPAESTPKVRRGRRKATAEVE